MSKTKRICIIAVLAALSTALNVIQMYQPNIRIAIYAIPLLFAGVTMNKLDAFLTGLLTGVVSQLFSIGPWGLTIASPIWALPAIAWSTISYYTYHLVENRHMIVKYAFVVIVSALVAYLLNTLAMVVDPWYNFELIKGELLPRFLIMIVMNIPYTAIMLALDYPANLYREDYQRLKLQQEQKVEE